MDSFSTRELITGLMPGWYFYFGLVIGFVVGAFYQFLDRRCSTGDKEKGEKG